MSFPGSCENVDARLAVLSAEVPSCTFRSSPRWSFDGWNHNLDSVKSGKIYVYVYDLYIIYNIYLRIYIYIYTYHLNTYIHIHTVFLKYIEAEPSEQMEKILPLCRPESEIQQSFPNMSENEALTNGQTCQEQQRIE